MDNKVGSRISGGNSVGGRNASDFYPTPPEPTIALMKFLDLPKDTKIWEPACGENDMVDAIRSCGYDVIGTDIQMGNDYMTTPLPNDIGFIITNPPFCLAKEFINRSLEHGKPFALLMKSHFFHAKARYAQYMEHPPTYVLPLTWRPNFMFKTNPSSSPLMDMSWYVWETPYSSNPAEYIPLEKPCAEAVYKASFICSRRV